MENRVIKFRVWENEEKAWIKSFVVNCCSRIPNYITVSVSQFTGLNDGKGNEVFEGDIFEIVFGDYYWNKTKTSNGVVVFKFGGFHVEFKHLQTKELNYVELFKLLKNPEKVVIGNIYENPELLNDGRDQ